MNIIDFIKARQEERRSHLIDRRLSDLDAGILSCNNALLSHLTVEQDVLEIAARHTSEYGSGDAQSDETLRALAAPYAAHPDYNEEWRPTN